MIKLQDFARECGVTDRAIQKHLKTYAEELEGLYQRKGPNGTWLTDEACRILRSKMKQQPIVVGDSEIYRKNEDLQKEIEALKDKLILAQEQALLSQNALAEAQAARAALEASEREKKLLEGFIQDAKAEIRTLTEEKAEEVSKAKQEAAEAAKRAELAEAELAAYKNLPWYKKLRRG